MDFKPSVRNINIKDSKIPTTKKEDDFFYYTDANRFTIADTSALITSERTFDMPLHDLANNSKLLDRLHLMYLIGNYAVTYTFRSRARSFCNYIATFKDNNDVMYEKMLTNPVVRILILDESLLKEVKLLLDTK